MVRALALALALCTATPCSAWAQEAATCEDTPTDAEVSERLTFVRSAIRDHEPAMRRWWTTFALLHGTMLTLSSILAVTADDEGLRNEMIVGTTSSTLALLSLAILIPPLIGAGDAVRAEPEEGPRDRLRKLRQAEDILRRSASSADFLRSWFPAVGSLAYLGAASGTLLALERPVGALIHSGGGAILAIGRILLHPTGGRDAWRSYVARYPEADCEPVDAPTADPPAPEANVTPHGLGVGLEIRF